MRRINVIAAIDLGLENAVTIVFDDNTNPIQYKIKGFKRTVMRRQHNRGDLGHKERYKQDVATQKYIKHLCYKIVPIVIKDCKYHNVTKIVLGKLGEELDLYYWGLFYDTFNSMLQKQANEIGIEVKRVSENGTSHASCRNLDDFEGKYTGHRKHRMYITDDGFECDGDVNAAYNIMRKSGLSNIIESLLVQDDPIIYSNYVKVLRID